MNLSPSQAALAPGMSQNFTGQGGVPPYVYSLLSGTGFIDSTSGTYTAPALIPLPSDSQVVIQAIDQAGGIATAPILIGNALKLFNNVIETVMNVPGRVYLWDQKIFEPEDEPLYIIVQELNSKAFGNNTETNLDGVSFTQSVNVHKILSVDLKSRNTEARDRKEEFVMALNSYYSKQQQALNSFRIFPLPVAGGFVNLSELDGAAIPYRFNISVAIQYFVKQVSQVPYFDTFPQASVTINS